MINVRYFAIAFIHHGDKTLMLKRNGRSKIASNLWAPVGGHIDEGEHTNPQEACYREIEEETGLRKEDLEDLKLVALVLRKKALEIRLQYVYEAKALRSDLCETEEGDLHYLTGEELKKIQTTFTTDCLLKTMSTFGDKVMVGVVDEAKGQPQMTWSPIEDWDKKTFK